MKKIPKILVIGSINMDMICTAKRLPENGETVPGMTFGTAPGGKGANQAVAAARLGANVTMLGKVGDDAFGRELIKTLSDSGVDTSRIMVTKNASTGVADIQIERAEHGTDNRIVVIPGANNEITLSDIEFLADSIGEYDMLILQNEIPEEINTKAAEYARAAGVPVMLNPAPYRELSAELLSHVTYISPNEHEAKLLTGIEITGKEDAKKAIEAIKALGVSSPLITLGGDGCAVYTEDGVIFAECAKIDEVVDPTAAGDSFIGAFCTATAYGIALDDALLFANHTAGITVSGMGAQPSLPKLDAVLALIKENGHDATPFDIMK